MITAKAQPLQVIQFPIRRIIGLGAIASVLILFSFNSFAQTGGKQILHGHIPAAIAHKHLLPIRNLSPTNELHLAIGLPFRNQERLNQLLSELYDPADANYRHFLTPAEFAERFAPSQKDYDGLIQFAKANGLTVTATFPNRALVCVKGKAATVEKVFHTRFAIYRHPDEPRNFFAPETEPSIDLNVPVLQVSGLDNFATAHPAGLIKSSVSVAPSSGSGSGGSYMGKDFRAAYAPGVTLDGTGQSVGLVELDGYLASDITNYEFHAGLPNVPLQNVYINGFSGTPSSDDTEVCLDIEMVIAMATNLDRVVVFEGTQTIADFDRILNSMAASNQIKQFSSSWGFTGSSTDANADQAFINMAAQGQSFFQASGDGDAWVNTIAIPSASPYVTSVGGTTLTMNGFGSSYASETVWNWGYDPPAWPPNGNGYWGSGGGVSTAYTIPNWQTNISMTANQGSPTMRNIPDVALTASGIFVVANNGQQETGIGGTSCAAPLWAGFAALINQKAIQAGRPPVGFLNPAIYTIGKGQNYTNCFHDIATGNNFSSVSPTNYPAVTGYDLCTGLGTPKGLNLINALAIPDALFVTPGTGFSATGVTGGPFTTSSQTFLLTNSSNASLAWTFVSPGNLFGAFPSGGTLPAGGTTSVTVQLASNGLNLLPGIYSPTVTFSNLTSGFGVDRQFNLAVGQSDIQNAGFETADFSDWTFMGTGLVPDGSGHYVLYNGVVYAGYWSSPVNYGTNFVHSGIYGAALGEAGQLAYLYQTVPTIPGQNYLISFWLSEADGPIPDQFVVNWNTNWPATNTIFTVNNIGPMTWTNYQFIVTAAGTNAVLQFGARNDNGYFGLDDIAVYPIPSPSFRSIAVTNNVATFSWNAFTNLSYRIQYSTNLATGNWITLGTNKAVGSISSTNTITSDPQRFYRIQRLP